MKNSSKYITFHILLILACHLATQAQQNVKELKVGDQIPELELRNLINYSTPLVNLSSFKGKLLILDFWNVHCSYSVEGFQRMEALQNSFNGKIQVIRITRNTDSEVKKLLSHSKMASASKLPFLSDDTLFIKMFPVVLPHQAWIDASGKVIAITSAMNASKVNAEAALNGGKVSLPPIYYFEDFDPKLPLFTNAKIGAMDHMKQYSFYTGFINGINYPAGYTIDSVSKKIIRRAYYNTSIKNLVKAAYGGFNRNLFGDEVDDRKIIFEVKDVQRIDPPKEASMLIPWKWQNAYCYEIQVLPKDADRIDVLMQEDIERFFSISVNIEPRRVHGFKLVRINDNKLYLSAGGNSLRSFDKINRVSRISNLPVEELMKSLSFKISALIVDATGIKDRIDINLRESHDLETIRKDLSKYGLDLIETEVEVDMLVIKDK